jgi:hypothetical protein
VSGFGWDLGWGEWCEARAALGTTAVDLEAVGFDVVAGAGGDLVEEGLDVAGGEVVHGAALGANDVVVMSAAREAVLERAVIEDDLAESTDVLEQAERAEHGGAADAGRGGHERLGGEVVTHGLHPREECTAGGGDAVAAAGDVSFDGLEGDHEFIVRPS